MAISYLCPGTVWPGKECTHAGQSYSPFCNKLLYPFHFGSILGIIIKVEFTVTTRTLHYWLDIDAYIG